jgi:hypothetical protein
MNNIFVVLGPPASGKTTWINNYVSKHEGSVPIVFDSMFNGHWIDMAGNKRSWSKDMMDQCSYHFYRCLFWTQTMSPIRKVSRYSHDWLIEPPQPLRAIEARCLREKADRVGYGLTLVWCNASIEERMRRNRLRGDSGVPELTLSVITTSMNIAQHLDPCDIIWWSEKEQDTETGNESRHDKEENHAQIS